MPWANLTEEGNASYVKKDTAPCGAVSFADIRLLLRPYIFGFAESQDHHKNGVQEHKPESKSGTLSESLCKLKEHDESENEAYTRDECERNSQPLPQDMSYRQYML